MKGDISDPRLLKAKGILFLILGTGSAGILIAEQPDRKTLILLAITIWAFCRFYYFAFYVLHHYADPDFKYSGLFNLLKYFLHSRTGASQVSTSSGSEQ